APDFAASADPEVSFDGTRILFSGKRTAADSWQIYEVTLPGGEPRRISSGAGDCTRPSYLPENSIVYTRDASWIETVALAGGAPERISHGAAPVLTAGVLRDGRILFETLRAGGGREI